MEDLENDEITLLWCSATYVLDSEMRLQTWSSGYISIIFVYTTYKDIL